MKQIIKLMFLFISIATFISANNTLPVAVYDESKVDSLCNIVRNNGVSYSKKFNLISDYSYISFYSGYFDKLRPMFGNILEESYRNSHKVGILFSYTSLANLYLSMDDKENTKKHLDSAEVYIDMVDNIRQRAMFYGVKGRYIQRYFPDRTPEAINNYQNSLYYYDKSGVKGKEDEKAIILRNLTMDGFQRNDSIYVYKGINKILELRASRSSPITEFTAFEVNAVINEMHYKKTHEERYLDSIIYYTKKCIELHESGLMLGSFDYIAVDFYTIIAEAMSQKSGADAVVVDSLYSIAESKYDILDSVGVARVYQIKANTFLKRNMIDSAEIMALKAQKYIESGKKYNNYSLAKNNAGLLRDIYNVKGDYKKAIVYDDIMIKKDEEIRANEIKELELQFEVFVKDSELKQLNSDILYHERVQILSVFICILLCLAVSFLVLLFRSKKKELNRQMALIDAEREETKLQLKLKEEQTIKTQLERYDVLSDFYLKEMELIGKTKDLEQLCLDRESLDQQVELFRQKVESYEINEAKAEQTNNDVQNVIVEDVKRVIVRSMPNGNAYINNIDFLNKSYVAVLNERSDGALSVSYLKYCVCFGIGMSISDVAECFNIEQSSVHMIRYRLKKKFGLNNDDDLGAFLQSQF